MYICIYTVIYVYICIYMERERERCIVICVYIHVCTASFQRHVEPRSSAGLQQMSAHSAGHNFTVVYNTSRCRLRMIQIMIQRIVKIIQLVHTNHHNHNHNSIASLNKEVLLASTIYLKCNVVPRSHNLVLLNDHPKSVRLLRSAQVRAWDDRA